MSGSAFLPDFKSYVSLGLENTWLANTVNSFGYLLIEHADTLKNGRFKLTTATTGTENNATVFTGSGFTVYSSALDAPDATKATDGQLKTGDKIYYYNHNDQTHTLVATVATELDGYYDNLKLNFDASASNANILALGQALQYGAGSLGARSFNISLYNTDDDKLGNDVVPASTNPIVLNRATDGFNFEDIRLSFTENANAIFAAAGSDTAIAYSAKDTLENGAGNYNGTFLEISAVSDSTAYMAAAGDLDNLEEMSPAYLNALNKMFGVVFGDIQGQKLGIDATGKSFTYDAQTHTLKVGDASFATVSFGESGNSNNPIKIEFTSASATKALVNEVLQSITYQNTQDALFPLNVIGWNLKAQTGVDANNNPIINTLTSGQSLITLTSSNDAPVLHPNLNTLSYAERLDFDGQAVEQIALQQNVYSSENTKVLSHDLFSKGAGVLVAESGVSTFTFDSPQTSVSLDFFNGIKALANLSADDLAALGDSSTGMFMMAGMPYRKVSFFNANNELLGISEVTDLEMPSLSLFFSLMVFLELSGDNTSLLNLLPELDKLYNARFTAPQGQTIKSVKIESIATTLIDNMGDGTPLPVLLDSITFGEVTTPSLTLPPLTAGQTTEFVVGEMIPTGTIVDPDIFPWDSQTTPKAIAVSAVDALQGEWKYKIGNGEWTAFDFGSNTGTALLLTETDRLQFTPNQDFDGVLNNAITFYAWDKTTGNAGDYLTISGNTGTDKTLSIDSVSASAMTPQLPTLTEIAPIPAQDAETQEITFAQLLAASDAADIDGEVVAFVVKSISGGTLKIGVDAATATDFDNETNITPATNDTITAVKKIFWTPTQSDAVFSVVAKDNDGTESTSPVQVSIEKVNHAPVITSTPITTTAEDSVYSYSLTATDAEGDSLTWSVTEDETLPAWLSLLKASSATSDFATDILKPGGVASDLAGNTYVISQYSPYQIYKIAPDGTKTNFGQTNVDGTSYGMTFDSGNLYVSINTGIDAGKIFKYGSNGTQSLLATIANGPMGMTVKDGYLYVAVLGAGKIQKVDLSNGTVSDYKTVALPYGVAFDANGVMYVAEYLSKKIVKFLTTATDEIKTEVLTADFSPTDIKIDANNNLYVSTSGGGLFKYENLGTGTKTSITSPKDIFGMSLNSNGAILMGDAATGREQTNKVVKLQTSTALTGTPTNDDVGSHNIKLSVTDGTATLSHDFTLVVENMNDAPTDLGDLTLASVQQNTASPTGAAISTLTGLNFVDVDAGSSLSGVAVVGNTANSTTQGKWQYSTNAGTNWFDIGEVADDATALALSAATRVRFVPVANYNGTPTALTVRVIDETYNSDFSTTQATETRVTVNAEENGSTTAISANANTISTTITTPPPPPADPEPMPQPVPPVVEPPKTETKPEQPTKPVSSEIEMQVPSASGVKGDGNGDGIPDVDQKNVISLPTQKVTGDSNNTEAPKVFLSIELPQGQILTKAEVKSVAEMTKDKPITFATETMNDKGETVVTETAITEETAPFGLFEFNFAGVPTTTDSSGNLKGGTTDVKLYLDDNQTVEKYLKQTVSGTWEPIPFSYVYDEKLGKTVVSISLTDGDKFDLDGKIDGGIFDPGTPIIAPKLTVAPEPVIVEILPKPTTKVFVGYDRTFSLGSGAAQFFGQGAKEVLELGTSASNAIADQNIEHVRFTGLQSDYTFEQTGNALQVAKGSVMIAQITIQDDANGSLFSFTNGTQSAKLVSGVIEFLPYTVVTDDIPRSIYQKASVFTAQGETIGIDSELVDVYGSSGADVIVLAANATKITIDQNVEQVNFAGNFVDYRFAPAGNSLDIFVGTTQIANINVQDDSDGTKLTFADGEHFAKFTLPTEQTPLSIEITGVTTNL